MQQGAAGEQREDGPSRALRTLSVTIGDSISESFTWLRERVKPAIPRNSSSSVLDFAGAISSASVSEDGAPRSTQSKEGPPNARRSGKRTSDGTESRSKVNDGEPRQMRDSSDLQVRRKKKKKRHSRDEHEEAHVVEVSKISIKRCLHSLKQSLRDLYLFWRCASNFWLRVSAVALIGWVDGNLDLERLRCCKNARGGTQSWSRISVTVAFMSGSD